jgi:hypothetical protein
MRISCRSSDAIALIDASRDFVADRFDMRIVEINCVAVSALRCNAAILTRSSRRTSVALQHIAETQKAQAMNLGFLHDWVVC